MATSPLTWKEIQDLREAAHDLTKMAARSAFTAPADEQALLDRSASLMAIADKFDYGYVAGKPRALHPNPACYHCGRRDWDTVEKLASHYIRRHGYVDENSYEAHETSYDVIGQYAADKAFRREGVPDGGA